MIHLCTRHTAPPPREKAREKTISIKRALVVQGRHTGRHRQRATDNRQRDGGRRTARTARGDVAGSSHLATRDVQLSAGAERIAESAVRMVLGFGDER